MEMTHAPHIQQPRHPRHRETVRRALGGTIEFRHFTGSDCNGWGLELDKVGGSLPKQCRNTAVESAVEVLYADDTSGVYKISMVRMSTTD